MFLEDRPNVAVEHSSLAAALELSQLLLTGSWVGFISLGRRGVTGLVGIMGQLIHYPVSNSVQKQMAWEQ